MTRLLLLVLAVCLPALLFAADWPQWRGPNADGISPETGINKDWTKKQLVLRWRMALTDDGYAGPSVADGKVFIIDHQGTQDIVRAFNLDTGQEAWRYAYEDARGSNYGFTRSTPTYDNGKLYTLSRWGQLHCLNAKTGEKIWVRNLIADFGGKRPQWDLAMSPVIDGEKVIVCPGGPNAAVAALNKVDGKTIWQGGGSDAPGYATPVIATINEVKQYVIFSASGVMGVAAADGKALWGYPWKTQFDVNAATPLVIGNAVFITSGYGHGCAMIDITPQGPVKRWESKAMQAHFTSPIYYNGYIYGNSDPDHLVCLDPKDSRVMWRQAGFEKGGLVLVDGVILALGGSNGNLVMAAINPAGFQEISRVTPLGGQSWTAPIVAGGKIIIRNKQMIGCIEFK